VDAEGLFDVPAGPASTSGSGSLRDASHSASPLAVRMRPQTLARVEAVRFGAEDPKGGGVLHGARVFSQPTCHHKPDVLGGIGEEESAALLRSFFEQRR